MDREIWGHFSRTSLAEDTTRHRRSTGRVECYFLTLNEGHDSIDVISCYCLDGEYPGSGVLPVASQQDVSHGLKRIEIYRLPWVTIDISLKNKQTRKQIITLVNLCSILHKYIGIFIAPPQRSKHFTKLKGYINNKQCIDTGIKLYNKSIGGPTDIKA